MLKNLLALLVKWLWRFGVEEQAFWRGVIVDKYGVLDGAGAGAGAGGGQK